MGNVISIISDSTASNVASNRLGPGSFTGDTNVEFTFVGSVSGSLNASTFPSPGHSASQDLVRGVEELVSATIGHEEAGRVSLAVGMRPRVDIITDIGKSFSHLYLCSFTKQSYTKYPWHLMSFFLIRMPDHSNI